MTNDEELSKMSFRMGEINEEINELENKKRELRKEQSAIIAKWHIVIERRKNANKNTQ